MIPSKWPNINKWAIDLLRPALPSVEVGSKSKKLTAPYKEVLVNAVYGARQTPITRFVSLDIEVTVTYENGSADTPAAVELANEIGFLIESAARTAPIVTATVTTGPAAARTTLSDPEFVEMTVELVISRA